ncbi:MAG TPA: MtrB/PioB family outer membrane beta-barrel protein [Chthoniobacterales bacterium]|nr:MtrB/PioB family outer membrane beta-barrel protein [Chthoniobacterales bacterium]
MRKLFAIVLGLGVLQLPAQAGVDANGTKTPEPETEAEFTNWITLGIGGVSLDGDAGAFQERHWINDGIFGGLEDLHWEPKVGDKATLKIDGRALGGIEDYLASIELTVTDVGYIKAGYRKFRTWYDGHGGYFPPNDLFFELYDNDFSIDRENIWVELGLRLPKWPEITFRYERQSREGEKDSTSWGDTTLTGVPGANNARNIVPTFLGIDEMRHIFALDLKHAFGKTDVGLGVRYETQETDNTRNVRRRPGEPTTDRIFTQRDQLDYDLFSTHFYQTTRLNKQLQFSAAYMFTTLNSDIGGTRLYGQSYDPVFDPVYARRQRRDEGFIDQFGGSQLDQHVATLNLSWRPTKDWVIIPSFRYEHNDLNSVGNAVETIIAPTGPIVMLFEPLEAMSERSFDSVTESLEARYTGLKKWTFYAKGEWMQEELDQIERDFELTEDAPSLLIGRDTNGDINSQKYVVGANWYPQTWLNVATQYYKKIYVNDYDHTFDTTPNNAPAGDRYPAFLREQDFNVDDFNIRVTWRPITNLTSVSRYDFQKGTIDTRGDFLGMGQSADITAHILSESITWSPLPRLYIQGAVHYVLNETDTPADQRVGMVVQDMENNYWNGSITAGYALSDKTDLQVNYFYYRADNFQDNSLVSVPYGSDAEEHAITATLNHEFTKNIRGSLKYGFFNNRTEAYGGRHDYDAHLLATSLQYRF